ncbi:hypothetical protein [Actinocorallia populi]|uniref:hypothetical protein n=1 Tax=Actinocorallia populi TaxID=2079200 RepID=UPI000D095088|nr:hypothetical protein [Actinocorallia populi]
MTTGSGDGEPVDLRSLRAVDALFDRLAERRSDPAGEQDAAVRLLLSLLEDVDAAEEAPRVAPEAWEPLCAPGASRRSGGSLGVRAAVAVGVASAVLATGGVAAGWKPDGGPQSGHSAGAGVKGGPAPPERGQERPPDSRPSSLSITPST